MTACGSVAPYAMATRMATITFYLEPATGETRKSLPLSAAYRFGGRRFVVKFELFEFLVIKHVAQCDMK